MEGNSTGTAAAVPHSGPTIPRRLDLHFFQQGGVNYLFFPRSARLYQLSRSAARIVKELCAGSSSSAEFQDQERFPQLRSSLNDLLQHELAIPAPAPADGHSRHGNSFQAFSIYLSQSCNMACRYCWNRGGSFGDVPRLMSEQEALRSTAQIVSLAAASSAEKIAINFYGGEPLLNFSALKAVTLGLREHEAELGKRFNFSVDTNGLLLEGEVARFLALHFSQIGVSLDGREEVHDRQRPAAEGERTWRRIAGNIRDFPDKSLLGVRATLTPCSDSYLETFCHLAKLGVRSIQLEYCHSPAAARTDTREQLLVPLERQRREMTEFVEYYVDAISHFKETGGIPFIPNLMENIFRIRRGARYTRPCGAGLNMVAFNCAGEMFPCIALVDRPELMMGETDGRDPLKLPPEIAEFAADRHEICGSCWLRYDCAGGCFATHLKLTGSISRPDPDYCLGMKSKTEVYLHALALMLDKCPWHLEDPGEVYGEV